MLYKMFSWLGEKLRKFSRSNEMSYREFISEMRELDYEEKEEANGVKFAKDPISIYLSERSEKVRITYLDSSVEGRFKFIDILGYLRWKKQQKERSTFSK